MTRMTLAALALLAAGCASSPPAPAKSAAPAKPLTQRQILVGRWTCTTEASPMTIKTEMIYSEDGAGTFHLNVSGGQAGMSLEAVGDGTHTWALSENDTKLTDKIETVKITSAKLNGADQDPAMIQAMLEPSLKGQSSTASVSITPTKVVETTPEATTTCTR